MFFIKWTVDEDVLVERHSILLPFGGWWRVGVVPVCVFVANAAVVGVDVEFTAHFLGEVSCEGNGIASGVKHSCRSVGSCLADAPAAALIWHDVLSVSFHMFVILRHRS